MRAPRFTFRVVCVLLATIGATVLAGGCSGDSKPDTAQPIDIEEQSLLQDRIQQGMTTSPAGQPR